MNDNNAIQIKELETKIKKIYSLLDEAERFADKHQLSFRFDPSFGLGGEYQPQTPKDGEQFFPSQTGWLSSQNC